MSNPAPDDIYNHDIDFTALALKYPDFAKRLKPNRQLDFTDPESVRQLTLTLLHLNHALLLTLPPNRLCPPVPNRFNYILQLQRLLDSTSPTFNSTFDPSRSVLGLDIGCGASCIYPLLGCRQRSSWQMLATEIDEYSRQVAQDNINQNDLSNRIMIIDTDPSSKTLIPVKQLERFDRIDFLMTNPPFYASEKHMLESAKAKSRPPYSSCTGSAVEMIYPYHPKSNDVTSKEGAAGKAITKSKSSKDKASSDATHDPQVETEGGEVVFVSQLLNESLSPSLWRKIQWFTVMLGHFSSLSIIITRLKDQSCTNYAVWEFVQGSKTKRWGVAWSWKGLRPSVDVARGVGTLEKKMLPFPSETEIEVGLELDGDDGKAETRALQRLGDRIDEAVSSLEDEDDEEGMQWQWKEKQLVGLGMSRKGDCWSRKARRKREGKSKRRDEEMKDADADGQAEYEDDKEPELVFKISLRRKEGERNSTIKSKEEGGGTSMAVVNIRWLQGQDSVLFESFCGWLKRKITN